MGVLNSVEKAVVSRVEDLRIVRQNTQEFGVGTPIVSLEIAALQVISGGVNFVKAITGNKEANI